MKSGLNKLLYSFIILQTQIKQFAMFNITVSI